MPGVVGNQPTPDPNKADVSIQLSVNNRIPRLNEEITYLVSVSNAGGLTATGVSVTAYLPAGQTFVPGDNFGLSGGNPVGGVSSIAAGGTVTLRLRAVVTAAGYSLLRAELTALDQPDPDSTPNNGTTNGEDDTAQVDIRAQ